MAPPTKGKGKPTPAADSRTIAHHIDSASFNLAHGTRHAEEAAKATGQAAVFEASHAAKHLAETKESLAKLRDSVSKKVPAIEPELSKLEKAKKK